MALWLMLFIIYLHTLAPTPCVASRYSCEPAITRPCGGTLDFYLTSREVSSFWITKTTGLPSLSVICFPLYSYILVQQFPVPSSLTQAKPPCDKQRHSFCTGFWRLFIILILLISGNIHPNPRPAPDNPAVSNLSFNDFCERKSLGFLHVNIHSLLPKLDLLQSRVHTGNPDVLAISESWLKKCVSPLREVV